jgi:biotin carboxyl carrier protein
MSNSRRPGKKAYLFITLFAVLLVLFPFLFWYYTWFGRRLSDADIDQYFADSAKPRNTQHALVQVGERIAKGQNVSRWYPKVIRLATSPTVELRQTAAWIMGQDRKYSPFHDTLLRLIHDPEPMVRRNAALSLAAFGDSAGRPELIAILRTFTVTSPGTGTVQYRLKLGDYVNPGTLVARVAHTEVRSPIPGQVRVLDRSENAAVQPGDPLISLSADKNHVWEALRALHEIGQPEDLDDIERYLRPIEGMPETVARQAALTVQAIRARNTAASQ